ncbi:MAG: P-loop NTPase [Deltaproteobacteria bacterium]|nr:P-loop NTPase [Deltaproteobacteria bacterium]
MSEEKNKAADSLKAITESKELTDRMGKIKHKIMVLSGKGGVGKSTVAANIAVSLALEGGKVGLLDTDFHGPSIPTLLNLEGKRPGSDGKAILPIEFSEGLKVMSIGFLLQNKDDAVIWRGPMKMKVIKQLRDEPLSVAQLIPGMDGAVIITTPQNLSLNDVKKCINFCRQLSVPVLGVVENMSGLICPNCKTIINVFKTGGGEKMASEMGVPFLGKIPIDPQIVEASDSGKPFVYHYGKTEAAKAFTGVVQPLLQMGDKTESGAETVLSKEEKKEGMHKIAIPVVEGHLSAHFGHCEEFAIFDVDFENKKIVRQEKAPSPPHEPGLLPRWLAEKGVNIIIAGGMGTQAQQLFANSGITVSVGASAGDPEKLIISYMDNALELGDNTCDH